MQVTLKVNSIINNHFRNHMVASNVLLETIQNEISTILASNNNVYSMPYHFFDGMTNSIIRHNGILDSELNFLKYHYPNIKNCMTIYDIAQESSITVDETYIESFGKMQEVDWEDLVRRLQELQPKTSQVTNEYIEKTVPTKKPDEPVSRAKRSKSWFGD